jgi:hypothetical protein
VTLPPNLHQSHARSRAAQEIVQPGCAVVR